MKRLQVRKNHSTRAKSSQSAKLQNGEDFHPKVLGLFDDPDGFTEQLDLSRQEYTTLTNAAAAAGQSFLTFMCAAAKKAADKPIDMSFSQENDHPSCLCLYDCLAGAVVSKIPLSSQEFTAIILAGQPDPAQFVATAVREKLAGSSPGHIGHKDEMWIAMCNLETQVQATKAFISMLLTQVDLWSDNGSCPTEKTYWELQSLADVINLEGPFSHLEAAYRKLSGTKPEAVAA